jgi:hypothetical protein
MAYTAPTTDDFTARFPQFEDTDSDQIQAVLDEAINSVDTSWREVDYAPAILYLTAHLLTVENSSGAGGGSSSGIIASESFGGMSISYDNSRSADDQAANSQYGSTSYGRSFYRLLKLNKTGPVTV